MNIRAFGYYVLLAGMALLAASYYYYQSVNNDLFKAIKRSELYKKIDGYPAENYYRLEITKNQQEQKSLIFGSIGGVIAFLGFGIIMTTKPESNTDGPKIMQQVDAANE